MFQAGTTEKGSGMSIKLVGRDVFAKVTHTKKQLFVAANGARENFCFDDLISGVVTLDDLFKSA
jgi:hypothetical protein